MLRLSVSIGLTLLAMAAVFLGMVKTDDAVQMAALVVGTLVIGAGALFLLGR
jgi:hypothetical protein